MSTDTIVRLQDVLEAVGNEPVVLDDYDMVQVQERIDWSCTKSAIDEIKPLPFGLHELTKQDLATLHGDFVIVSAPGMSIDKKIVPCLGNPTDANGEAFIVLDGELYNQELFDNGAIKLYSVL